MKKTNIIFVLFILILFSGNSNSENLILDNLKTPGKTTQGQKWSFITDKVMGGLSNGKLTIDKVKNKSCYRMTGIVTTENNGGFIQTRAIILPHIQIKKFKGIYIKVFGNDKNYNLHLRTGITLAPWQYYGYSFFSPSEWVVIKAPFTEFKKSNFYQPKNLLNQKIKSIGLVAAFDDFKSDICFSEIGFY